jgi:hypothetical protein
VIGFSDVHAADSNLIEQNGRRIVNAKSQEAEQLQCPVSSKQRGYRKCLCAC